MYDTINMKRCFVCGGPRPLPTCSSGQTGSGHCHHVGDGLGKQGHTGLRPLPTPHPNLSRSLALCRGLACARSFHTHTRHIHTHPCTYTCLCRWRSRCSRPWRVVTWNSPRWRPTAQSHSLSTIRCACITTRPFFSLRKAHVRAVCVCRVCTRADYRGWGGASGASQRNARAARRWAPALWRHAGSCTPPNTAPIWSGVHYAMSLHTNMQETTCTMCAKPVRPYRSCSRLHIVRLYMYTHRTVTAYSGRL